MNTKQFDPYDISKKEIDTVPVYFKHIPWAPCIHIYITFKTKVNRLPLKNDLPKLRFIEFLLRSFC